MEYRLTEYVTRFVSTALRGVVMFAVVPFSQAFAICEDGCPGLPPWCQDGVPDNCQIEEIYFEIKPYSDERCLRLDGNGVIPVMIYGSDVFHVDNIDTSTLSLNGLDVRVRGATGPLCSTVGDTNQDGFPDMLCQFEDDPTQWIMGNALAELNGQYLDGVQFSGSGTMCIQ